jgi:hypothetical protein
MWCAVQGSDAHAGPAEDDVCRDDFLHADERPPPLLSGQPTVESSMDGDGAAMRGDAQGAEALKRLERRHKELSGLLVWTQLELNTTNRSVHMQARLEHRAADVCAASELIPYILTPTWWVSFQAVARAGGGASTTGEQRAAATEQAHVQRQRRLAGARERAVPVQGRPGAVLQGLCADHSSIHVHGQRAALERCAASS